MDSICRKHPTHIGNLPISLAYFLYCTNVVARRVQFPTKQSPRHAGDCFGQNQERPRNDIPLGDQSLLPRHADGRIAGFDAELVVDRAEVRIHRAATDDEPLGDLGVAQFLGEQAEHLDFARRQGFAGDGWRGAGACG